MSSSTTPDRFTADSVEAASHIYEDCRARGQTAEEAMRRSVGRLIESAMSPRTTYVPLHQERIDQLEVVLRNWSSRENGPLPTDLVTLCAMAGSSLLSDGHTSETQRTMPPEANELARMAANDRRYRWLRQDTGHLPTEKRKAEIVEVYQGDAMDEKIDKAMGI